MTSGIQAIQSELEQLPLEQLQTLQPRLLALILRREEDKRRTVLEEIARLAGEAGLTPESVEQHLKRRPAGRSRRRAGKLPPKYRNPEDPANTWAGRGKRPKWLEAKLAAGGRLEDFLIAGENDKTGQLPPNALPSAESARAGAERGLGGPKPHKEEDYEPTGSTRS